MAAEQRDTNCPIQLVERAEGHELHIRELLLWVKAADLRVAYDELMRRKREIVDLARLAGAPDELPRVRPAQAIAAP